MHGRGDVFPKKYDGMILDDFKVIVNVNLRTCLIWSLPTVEDPLAAVARHGLLHDHRVRVHPWPRAQVSIGTFHAWNGEQLHLHIVIDLHHCNTAARVRFHLLQNCCMDGHTHLYKSIMKWFIVCRAKCYLMEVNIWCICYERSKFCANVYGSYFRHNCHLMSTDIFIFCFLFEVCILFEFWNKVTQ